MINIPPLGGGQGLPVDPPAERAGASAQAGGGLIYGIN